MKFEARKIDLDLELTTLDGSTFKLKPTIKTSANSSLKMLNLFEAIENDNAEERKKDESVAIKIIAQQLASVYDKDQEWFMDNFDVRTLSEIIGYVSSAMVGLVKNEEGSN